MQPARITVLLIIFGSLGVMIGDAVDVQVRHDPGGRPIGALVGLFIGLPIADQLNKLAAHRRQADQVIEDGKTVSPKDGGKKLMGPRRVIIRPNNAVIFERGTQQTRVSGPGTINMERSEYVARILDLRVIRRVYTFSNVLTTDLVTTSIRVVVICGIDLSPAACCGKKNLEASEEEALRHVHAWTPNWWLEVKSVLEASIRSAISQETLLSLLDLQRMKTLEVQVQSLTNARVCDWGVRVHQVILESILPEKQVAQATTRRWIANTEGQTADILTRAQATSLRDALLLLADAYQTAQALGMSETAIHRETLRHTIEQIVKEAQLNLFVMPDLNRAP